MRYNITQFDKELLLQGSMQYNYRLFVIDSGGNVIDELSGLQAIGSYSINADSKIRRTASFTMYLNNSSRQIPVEKKLYEWIGFSFQLQIGIYSLREDSFRWYDCGYYLISAANTSYNSVENSITTTLSDWYARLDGTRNGQAGGAPVITLPNLDAAGRPVTIKQATENLLRGETDIRSYIIEDVGQFYGMPQNNPDYLQYRAENPLWNQLPYDLEYEAGCTVGDILSELCDLYPNCQMFFDIYGNFCFSLIPSCAHDRVILDDSFLQEILTGSDAESVTYDIEAVKNITEVFGVSYDIDRISPSCTTSANLYTLSLDGYDSYRSGDIVAFTPNTENGSGMRLRINGLNALPIYREYTTDYVAPGLLQANKTCIVRLKNTNGGFVAYYLGQYQPHALCVLTDNPADKTYTKAYFSRKYNCPEDNILLRVEEGSPFAVQKLGEILDVKCGDEFENILSDSVALETAVYYNRKSSSMHDTITISTKMIPFLDVNEKIEYRKQQDDKTACYIVRSITNNTDSKTSSITMNRFYPLYYI